MIALSNPPPVDLASACEGILGLTRTLAASAEAGDWMAVAEIQPRRDAMIRAFFRDHPAARLLPDLRGMLESVQQLERRVLALATERREQVVGDAGSVRRGRDAARAYGEHQPGP